LQRKSGNIVFFAGRRLSRPYEPAELLHHIFNIQLANRKELFAEGKSTILIRTANDALAAVGIDKNLVVSL
jgi:hypothetical protein